MRKVYDKEQFLFTKEELKKFLLGKIKEENEPYKEYLFLNPNEIILDYLDKYIDFITEYSQKQKMICNYRNNFGNLFPVDSSYQILRETYFVKCDEDQYILWYYTSKDDSIHNSRNIKLLNYILKKFPNLEIFRNDIKFKIAELKNIQNFEKTAKKNQLITLKQRIKEFEEYDIISKIEDSFKLDYNDVKHELYHFIDLPNITLEDKCIIYYLILVATKNIYFGHKLNGDQRQKYYNEFIENIPIYLDFLDSNRDKVTKELVYNKSCDARVPLWALLHNDYDYNYIYLQDFYYPDLNYETLKEIVGRIYFSRCIEEKEYSKAENFIKKHPVHLIDELKTLSKISYGHQNSIVNRLKSSINDEYNLIKNDVHQEIDSFLNTEDSAIIDLRIKPMLHFLISYYYYLEYKNDNYTKDALFNFLNLFKTKYEIDNFLQACKYENLTQKIIDLKISKPDEDVEKAVDNIHTLISNDIKVDSYDLNNIATLYPYIDFNNLNSKTKEFVATGEYIIANFNSNSKNFDYSAAVIEWSKAVELEMSEKLIKKLTKEEQKEINNYAKKINSTLEIKFIPTTLGLFNKLEKSHLEDYLYKNYYSKIYTFQEEEYKNLCTYVRELTKPRNDAAHKDHTIDIVTAKECQDRILAANKILTILSKLQLKTK